MTAKNPSTPEYFWSRVRRAGPDDCWGWTGHCDPRGYGRLNWRGFAWCTNVYAYIWLTHRIAYGLAHPRWRGKGCVLHSCDNRLCCNPAHLWVGTRVDNIADMDAKSRRFVLNGDNGHGMAKLSAQTVREIRSGGLSLTQMAQKYGVARTTVMRIRSGKTWRHVV